MHSRLIYAVEIGRQNEKQKQEIDKLRRRKKREIIQKDIQRQKKERAKERQRAKRNGE